ncbi:hypothetical protein MHLP_02790 [Candidatus Mycoplasma haematolamae str. Purdue]|uniref:Uncharacterized protein n=1 Tax=Mycoplasma haematolamae (strain Purdue) TaxID=1212765 RepID=I7BJU4_MYCHA|nr:hypothetical protein [Candidatus Mycoplasma haematolamae]AFO52138.1 hypothetical protein MHLP_02790 [Candidatus Mycoplasma haematolamae str. Purdue]
MTPILVAKILIPIGTIGGVSVAATPAIISSLDNGRYFKFRDNNGKKESVYLYCPFREGQATYPKVNWENKQITCGYALQEEKFSQQYINTISKYGQGLSCSIEVDNPDSYTCHNKEFVVVGPETLSFKV